MNFYQIKRKIRNVADKQLKNNEVKKKLVNVISYNADTHTAIVDLVDEGYEVEVDKRLGALTAGDLVRIEIKNPTNIVIIEKA